MRIFISYSSRNRPQVKALVQDLENTGHDVWYDQEAAGGHEWWADILENIRACELFIFALTAESLDSEACRREYRYAYALHKRILPVRLNKVVNPASLTVELQKINFVDYFSGAEQEYRQLVRAITSLKPPVPMPEPMPDEPPVPISPLGELREKIAARSIGVETQTYLVFELKQHVEKAATRAEALELLRRLQKHSDLRVGVANEIGTIIKPYMPRNLPKTPPKSARTFESRPFMVGGLMGVAAIILAVIGLVMLLNAGDKGNKQNPTGASTKTVSPTSDVTPKMTNPATLMPTDVARETLSPDTGSISNNQNPVINPISGQTCTVGDTLTVSLTYYDPEGNLISVTSFSINPSVASSNASGEPLSVYCLSAGSAIITVNLDDGRGGTASTSFSVTVISVQ